jgi:hypothetical protein
MSLYLFGLRVREFEAARPWQAIYGDPDGEELGFGGAPLDTGS